MSSIVPCEVEFEGPGDQVDGVPWSFVFMLVHYIGYAGTKL